MKKNSFICFRVSKELHESLARMARENKHSLSSTIEIVLSDYLKEKKTFRSAKDEKRQYQRKTLSVPAVISQHGARQVEIVSIADISLSGVKILLQKDFPHKVLIDSEGSRFEMVLNLPGENKSLKLSCESKNIVDATENIIVGAVFVDSDFQSCKLLQSYLV